MQRLISGLAAFLAPAPLGKTFGMVRPLVQHWKVSLLTICHLSCYAAAQLQQSDQLKCTSSAPLQQFSQHRFKPSMTASLKGDLKK